MVKLVLLASESSRTRTTCFLLHRSPPAASPELSTYRRMSKDYYSLPLCINSFSETAAHFVATLRWLCSSHCAMHCSRPCKQKVGPSSQLDSPEQCFTLGESFAHKQTLSVVQVMMYIVGCLV